MRQLIERSILILSAGALLSACAIPDYPTVLSTPQPAPVQNPAPTLRPPEPQTEPEITGPGPSTPIDVQPLDAPLHAARPAPAVLPPLPPPPASKLEPEPTSRTITSCSVVGPVIDVDGPPRIYRVKPGDSLLAIARSLDTNISQLARDNDLAPPYVIHPGDRLKAPGRPAKAYMIQSGDNLTTIGRRFGVSVAALERENGMARGAILIPGRRLMLPTGYVDRGPTVSGPQAVAPPPPPPAVETPEAPATRQVTTRRVSGLVIEMSGGVGTYRVRSGDTLGRVARRLGTTVSQLARDNRLRSPYVIRPGQVLRAPSNAVKAYVVGPGDTLELISRRFSVSVRSLRSENKLSGDDNVNIGRRLRLPKAYEDGGPIVTVETVDASSARSAALQAGALVPGGPVGSPPPSDAQISLLGRGRFIWPIQGEVISDFGPNGEGQRNDGIDIRAASGDPVRASAGGEVLYAGDQVPGFGNLVLIKHNGGWTTAYAHLSQVGVKIREQVTQGRQIGQVGASGGVSDPRLHFEVRFVATNDDKPLAINPTLVLPE